MPYRAYKYRLYPKDEQKRILNQWFAAVRWVYNAALDQRNFYGRAKGTDPFERDCAFNSIRQSKEINFISREGRPGLRDDPELAWIAETPSDCIHAALRDLDKAFDGFFKKRARYPTFRKADRNNSVSFKAWLRKKQDGVTTSRPIVVFGQDCVRLPKIGRVRYRRHRKFYGDPKTVEVTREGDEYFVVLTTEQTAMPVRHPDEAVGVDVGVALPLCFSTGHCLRPDDGLKALESEKRKAHRILSRRRRKGTNRRLKAKRRLQAISRKQARRRKARLHWMTTKLTQAFRIVALEDLSVANMTASAKGTPENPGKKVKQKSGLNREMLNVSPYEIRRQLEYKAEKFGGEVIAVDPKHTSQKCNQCGHTDAQNRRSQGLFICRECGHAHNADVNAARNILDRAVSAGAPARRKTPSEPRKGSATSKASASCFQSASVHKWNVHQELAKRRGFDAVHL